MSFVESIAEILAQKLSRDNIHLSNIKEDDFKIAALYVLADILEVPELRQFADLLLNMKTAKRTRNDLLKLMRAIQYRVYGGERVVTREVYVPKAATPVTEGVEEEL